MNKSGQIEKMRIPADFPRRYRARDDDRTGVTRFQRFNPPVNHGRGYNLEHDLPSSLKPPASMKKDRALAGRQRMRSLLIAAGMALALAGCDSSEDAAFSKGYAAYQQGDFTTALSAWQPLAEAGDARAQYNLGIIYSDGRGVPRNPKAALEWWRKAAAQGHMRAHHNLALALISGDGGVQDYVAAMQHLKITADVGFANSQYTMGKMLAEGLGAPKDEAAAMAYINKAAQQGFAKAQYNLAKAYRDGANVPQSAEQAAKWFAEAAKRGHVRAQRHIAFRLAEGNGVAKDELAALSWALIAANNGNGEAGELASKLRAQIPPDQITQAEARAAAFQPE